MLPVVGLAYLCLLGAASSSSVVSQRWLSSSHHDGAHGDLAFDAALSALAPETQAAVRPLLVRQLHAESSSRRSLRQASVPQVSADCIVMLLVGRPAEGVTKEQCVALQHLFSTPDYLTAPDNTIFAEQYAYAGTGNMCSLITMPAIGIYERSRLFAGLSAHSPWQVPVPPGGVALGCADTITVVDSCAPSYEVLPPESMCPERHVAAAQPGGSGGTDAAAAPTGSVDNATSTNGAVDWAAIAASRGSTDASRAAAMAQAVAQAVLQAKMDAAADAAVAAVADQANRDAAAATAVAQAQRDAEAVALAADRAKRDAAAAAAVAAAAQAKRDAAADAAVAQAQRDAAAATVQAKMDAAADAAVAQAKRDADAAAAAMAKAADDAAAAAVAAAAAQAKRDADAVAAARRDAAAAAQAAAFAAAAKAASDAKAAADAANAGSGAASGPSQGSAPAQLQLLPSTAWTYGAQDLSAMDIATILKVHNDARANHRVGALVWDNGLAEYARSYAEKCTFAHSAPQNGGRLYGENIGIGTMSMEAMVNMWLVEECSYNYASPAFTAGHFTQMMWGNTKRIGCSVVTSYGLCPNGMFVPDRNTRWTGFMLVCEYDPPGNYPDFGNWVKPPIVPRVCDPNTPYARNG
ncbi:hypothetical protein FOA52_009711 [Chlamydomonas sp. UWO 241]|nr:hypothetical protein FOA52_009711 [Chlamydomonas sp. UWO 241]